MSRTRSGLWAAVLATPVIILSLCAGQARAQESSWAGVWALSGGKVEATNGQGSEHIVFSAAPAEKPHYYRRDWSEQWLSEAKVTDSTADLGYDANGRFTEIHLERTGGRAQGTLKLVHPQYPVESKIRAVRVIDQPDWQPFAWLDQSSPVVNLIALLRKDLQAGQDKASKEFENKILYKYFILLDGLVNDSTGVTSQAKVHRLLQVASDPDVLKLADALADAREQVLEKVREQSSAFGFSNPFILMPSLGTFDKEMMVFGGRLAVKVGVDALKISPDQALHWVAREHLKLPTYRLFPPIDDSPTAVTIRGGLALMFAIHFGLGKDPLEFCDSRKTALTPEELADAKRKLKRFVDEQVRPDLPVDVMRLVGYQFAQQVVQAYPPDQILSTPMAKLFELYRSFLGS